MTNEQESILLYVLGKLEEAVWTYCTPEEIEDSRQRVVRYVRTLVDGTHFLSICTRPDHECATTGAGPCNGLPKGGVIDG